MIIGIPMLNERMNNIQEHLEACIKHVLSLECNFDGEGFEPNAETTTDCARKLALRLVDRLSPQHIRVIDINPADDSTVDIHLDMENGNSLLLNIGPDLRSTYVVDAEKDGVFGVIASGSIDNSDDLSEIIKWLLL
jgi:hypothetical protein